MLSELYMNLENVILPNNYTLITHNSGSIRTSAILIKKYGIQSQQFGILAAILRAFLFHMINLK